MKKRASLFLAIFLLCSLVVTVSADVLWEPYGNSYYRSHYQDCSYVNRVYLVPEHIQLNIYTAPEMGRTIMTVEGGTKVYVGYQIAVGSEYWGTGYPIQNASYEEGWFRMSRLVPENDPTLRVETGKEGPFTLPSAPLLLIAALIAAVTAGTAILIVCFRKKSSVHK